MQRHIMEGRTAFAVSVVVLLFAATAPVGVCLKTTGTCRRCMWNKQSTCTPISYGNSLISQVGPRGADDLTQWHGLSDHIQFCTGIDTAFGAELTSESDRPGVRSILLGRHDRLVGKNQGVVFNATNVLNEPLVEWTRGQPLPDGAFPFTRPQRAHPPYWRSSNMACTLESLPNEPWPRFTLRSTMFGAQVSPSFPPLYTVGAAPGFHNTPNGSSGRVNGLDTVSQQWQYWQSRVSGTPRIRRWTGSNQSGTWPEVGQFHIYGQGNKLFPGDLHSPFDVPAPLASDAYRLWCGPPVACSSRLDHFGCPGMGVCNCGVHGHCTGSGQCQCDRDWGGTECRQFVPPDLELDGIGDCPPLWDYDLCGGRGKCVKKTNSVGITCKCRPGWFGGTETDDLTLTRDQQVELYASAFFCGSHISHWTDVDGWMGRYPQLHQCSLYDGAYQPWNWELDAETPTVPVAPFKCADNRAKTNVPDKYRNLYGGFWCNKCANCSEFGVRTARCDDVDTTRAISAPFASSEEAAVKCVCNPGFAGELCNQGTCPWDAGDRSTSRHTPCGEGLGHGKCHSTPFQRSDTQEIPLLSNGEPALPWNSSFTGRCVCEDGWGGTNGDCSVEICPHATVITAKITCGYHGKCVQSACTQGALDKKLSTQCNAHCVRDCPAGPDWSPSRAVCESSCYYKCQAPKHYNYTQLSSCGAGSCVCDKGWVIDWTTGLCEQQFCPIGTNGFECSGQIIAAGHPRAGENVCNRDIKAPLCQCHLALAIHPSAGERHNMTFNGPLAACDGSYDNQCRGPVSHLWCGGFDGKCAPPGCVNTFDLSGGCKDPNARPACSCPVGTFGAQCGLSVCGGHSSAMPCSKNNKGVVLTGYCNIGTRKCECIKVGGIAYGGSTCADSLHGCTSVVSNEVCAGHGDCILKNDPGFTLNVTDDTICLCHGGYTGPSCGNAEPPACIGGCPLGQGSCTDSTCVCDDNYNGASCGTDQCTTTGGIVLTPNICNCSMITDGRGAVQYPNVEFDATPYSSFRGCRKDCVFNPFLPSSTECGGNIIDSSGRERYRCNGAPMAANAGPDHNPECSCLGEGINPFTGTMMNWTTDARMGAPSVSGCRPKCLHCTEAPTGLCNQNDCPQEGGGVCQYGGLNCDVQLCPGATNENGMKWNGTECTCPGWVYNWDNGSAVSSNCSVTVCEVGSAPGVIGLAPLLGDKGKCNCPFPARVDLNPVSPTYRRCVSACGPNGVLNVTSQACDCDGVFSGAACNVSLCAPLAGVPSANGSTCDCVAPQFRGMLCAFTTCLGGTPRAPPAIGCNCTNPLLTGTYCNITLCVNGFMSGPGGDATCACNQGWSGLTCDLNQCGPRLPIDPIACGGVGQPVCTFPGTWDFNCNCGVNGAAHIGTGGCATTSCGSHGQWASTINNTLSCVCDVGFVGARCTTHVCGVGVSAPHARQVVSPVAALPSEFNAVTSNHTSRYNTEYNWTCACASPYVNISSNCTHVNCSALVHSHEASSIIWGGARLVQESPTQCGCNLAGYHLEEYHPKRHLLGTVGEDAYYSAHLSRGLYPNPATDRWNLVCVRDCHRQHTRTVVNNTVCECQTGWSGATCTVFAFPIPAVSATPAPTPSPSTSGALPVWAWVVIGGGGVVLASIGGAWGWQYRSRAKATNPVETATPVEKSVRSSQGRTDRSGLFRKRNIAPTTFA